MNNFMLIGLGNPGKEYDSTRHNVGKMFVRFLKEHPVEGVEAMETECYMNESGEWLQRELQKRGITSSTGTTGTTSRRRAAQVEIQHETRGTFGTFGTSGTSLIIAHDDLDIPLGKFKIQYGKGPRQHKGILSIEGALGTTEFWRVRIGIDSRATSDKRQATSQSGEEYVLQLFSREKRRVLDAVFPYIREQLQAVVRTITRSE